MLRHPSVNTHSLMCGLGFIPTPIQNVMLTNLEINPDSMFVSGRQIGASTVILLDALHHAMSTCNTRIAIICDSLSLAGEYRYRLRHILQTHIGNVIASDGASSMHLVNKSMFQFFTGRSPQSLRGCSFDKVYLDVGSEHVIYDDLLVNVTMCTMSTGGSTMLNLWPNIKVVDTLYSVLGNRISNIVKLPSPMTPLYSGGEPWHYTCEIF